MQETISNTVVNVDGTMTAAATAAPAPAVTPSPWLASPFRFGRLNDDSKDEQLKRYTMIFQALAALATIFVGVYALTHRD